MHTYETLDTPDGPFTLVENAAGAVVASAWSADVRAVAARAGLTAGGLATGGLAPADLESADLESADFTPGACRASQAVRAFYAGDAHAPASVPVVQSGTKFQTAVWAALREIPPGEVRRYGELAAALGSPGASRAVGAACGRNAVALFVPCHRVVGASGALTGFAWGVDVKRSVLVREGVPLP